MKRSKNFLLMLGLFAAVATCHGQKTAAVIANCRSSVIDVLTASTPLGLVSNYTTTFDGTTGFPLGGSTNFSRELRPRAASPGTYEGDYLVFDASAALLQYGSFTVVLPTTDADGNGLTDILQYNISGNTGFTGAGHVDYSLYPAATDYAINGFITRAANSASGTMSLSIPSLNVTYTGTVGLKYLSGNVVYSRGSTNVAVFTLTSILGGRVLRGTNSFTVANSNQITMPQFTLTGSDSKVFTMKAATFNRSGNRYTGNVQFVDGEPNTSWPDFVDYIFQITDTNDLDADGIPDLSDNLPPPPPPPPGLVSQPQNQILLVGDLMNLSVTATGTAPLNFRWFKDSLPVSLATNSALAVTNVQMTNAGNYRAVVTNLGGAATSSLAQIVVEPGRPVITVQKSPTNVLLVWPLWATNYSLQSATSLSGIFTPSGVIMLTTNMPEETVSVALPATNFGEFFRLGR